MSAIRVRRKSGGRDAGAPAIPRGHGRRGLAWRTVKLVALACLVVSAVGCRTGSWMTKPSWMTLGQKSTDPDRLPSAPAFAGDVPKPSATAKPYPTTSTPEGYSLPDVGSQAATAPGATPAAVTYGSTPSPAAVAAAAPSTATPPAGAPVAPQVGPYATSEGAMPAETAAVAPPSTGSGWTSAAPSGAVPPVMPAEPPAATVSTAPPPWATATPVATAAPAPPQRFADARASSPAWTPAPMDPPTGDTRYPASATSRFSGGEMPAAASMLPTAVAPAAAPAALPAPPTELQPTGPATSLPAAAPIAPTRRPDPGYRPGGTSSYRPARSSLAGEPPSAVQPAGFEADAGSTF